MTNLIVNISIAILTNQPAEVKITNAVTSSFSKIWPPIVINETEYRWNTSGNIMSSPLEHELFNRSSVELRQIVERNNWMFKCVTGGYEAWVMVDKHYYKWSTKSYNIHDLLTEVANVRIRVTGILEERMRLK